jgi:hypothetical protein
LQWRRPEAAVLPDHRVQGVVVTEKFTVSDRVVSDEALAVTDPGKVFLR